MIRTRVAIWLVGALALASTAEAGVVTLKNGTTFQGTPTGELVLISTGKDLLEFLPETILSLRAGEIHLKDGRVITGTVVGERLRFKTELGEVAVTLTDLKEYRDSAAPLPAAPRSPPPSPRPTSPPVAVSPTAPEVRPKAPSFPERESRPAAKASPPAAAPAPPRSAPPMEARPGEKLFRVVASEAALYSEATVQAAWVGVVRRGEVVRYVDMIDRRLSLFGFVLDLGNWIKVETAGGLSGWAEAEMLQEVMEGASARWIAP